MIKINIHEAKSQLSKYIEMVEAGETIVVCKRNIPVAVIRPIEKKEKRIPILGSAQATGEVLPSFQGPMPDEELRMWEQGDEDDPLRKYAPKTKEPRK
jgi:prevent-host-death family protein